jgi:hypothetical protein
MERKELIDKIIKFCIEYKVFKYKVSIETINNRIAEILDDPVHVESLINTIIKRTMYQRNIDINKIALLRSELEKIKTELEHKERICV